MTIESDLKQLAGDLSDISVKVSEKNYTNLSTDNELLSQLRDLANNFVTINTEDITLINEIATIMKNKDSLSYATQLTAINERLVLAQKMVNLLLNIDSPKLMEVKSETTKGLDPFKLPIQQPDPSVSKGKISPSRA